MFKNTSSTQEEVTNKFIEEFYKESLGIEDKYLPRGIFSPEGRRKDSESRGSEEKLNKMATELSEKERIILLHKVKKKYKETITDLENRIRELEVDKKEQGASLSHKKVKDNPGQTKKNSSSRRRKMTELRKLMAMNQQVVLKETKDGDNINENKKHVAQIQGSRGDDDSKGSE
ncbi:12156_t:CDS:2 [Rhizophagus irregularis]|nr:12156_t:CDS:2 [Rhizophagus irregularis]